MGDKDDPFYLIEFIRYKWSDGYRIYVEQYVYAGPLGLPTVDIRKALRYANSADARRAAISYDYKQFRLLLASSELAAHRFESAVISTGDWESSLLGRSSYIRLPAGRNLIRD